MIILGPRKSQLPRTVRRKKFCKSLGIHADKVAEERTSDRVAERRSEIPCTSANAVGDSCAGESCHGYIFLECINKMVFKVHFQI